VGEDGNGKTTILEAINYLTQNKYSSENKLAIGDFSDFNQEITITAKTPQFICKMPYVGNYYESCGVEFIAKSRNQKSPGKLLSTPFQIRNCFINVNKNYKNSKGEDSGKVIDERFKVFSNSEIKDGEFNIFYFDKNRSRQIATGNYKTIFDKICDDLNWRFVKEYNGCDESKKQEIANSICGDYFRTVIDIAQKGLGGKLSTNLSDFFKNDEYQNLKIDLLSLLHPFTDAFFALRKENELKQISTRNIGSGIEIILTLLLMNSISGESKESIVYLIDEPELHLHPKAQEMLLEILMQESKDKQIIISTHSPYMFMGCSSNKKVGMLLFNRSDDGIINITDVKRDEWGLFPWSPSFGEINYHAYNLPNVEFHNELYGHIKDLSDIRSVNDFDVYLKNKKGITEVRDYIDKGENKSLTLCTYIRNQIHHPENKNNSSYTDADLRKSIEILIDIIRSAGSPISEEFEWDIPF